MKKTALFLVLMAATGLGACGKKPPKAAPAPPPVAPPTPPPAPPPTTPDVQPQLDEYARLRQLSIDELEAMGLLADVRFDYDRADLRDGDRAILAKNAEVLKKYDFIDVRVEGHCDERGSVEYNLALGERRAKAAYDYLVSLGIAAERLKTISYGKELPLCQEANESCWSRNRRAHLRVAAKR